MISHKYFFNEDENFQFIWPLGIELVILKTYKNVEICNYKKNILGQHNLI